MDTRTRVQNGFHSGDGQNRSPRFAVTFAGMFTATVTRLCSCGFDCVYSLPLYHKLGPLDVVQKKVDLRKRILSILIFPQKQA